MCETLMDHQNSAMEMGLVCEGLLRVFNTLPNVRQDNGFYFDTGVLNKFRQSLVDFLKDQTGGPVSMNGVDFHHHEFDAETLYIWIRNILGFSWEAISVDRKWSERDRVFARDLITATIFARFYARENR